MKKTGKKPLLLIGVAICVLALSGCHGARERGEFAVPEAFDTGKTYELTFWAKNDTNKTQTEIYQKAIDDFMAIYPNISVKMRLYTDYGKIYNDVITNITTGTTPNVCITYPDHIATYLSGTHVVVPLDELMADGKYGLGGSEVGFAAPKREEVIPEFLEDCRIGEHTYAMPFMRSTEACYINVDLLEKLGYSLPDQLTWDFVWEVSEAATAKNEDGTYVLNGQNVLIPFLYKSTDNMLIQILKQKGAGYSTEDGQVEVFNEDTKQVLYEVAEHVKSGAFSTFKISSYPANFLNAGQCIFAIDSTAGATWMGSEAPLLDISEDKVTQFETAVRPVPQVDPEKPYMISQGPSVCVFNKEDPQEVLASWLFVQYLLSDEVQIAYSETEGYVPVTSKARENPAYVDYLEREGEDNETFYPVKIQAAKLLLANTENTFTTPVFNGSASLRDAAGQMVETVAKSTRRKATVDEAYMENLFSEMVSLYRLDQVGAAEGDGARDLGPLPGTAVALLVCLALAWVLMGAIVLRRWLSKRR